MINHLADLSELLGAQGLRGPFGVTLGVRNLQRSAKVAFYFPNCSALASTRAAIVEGVDEPGLVERFYNQVLGASRYG